MEVVAAEANPRARIWKCFEEDQMVNWFYATSQIWNPQGTKNVMKVVDTYHAILGRVPLFLQTQYTRAEIVAKLIDLKEEYDNFKWFVNAQGFQVSSHAGFTAEGMELFIAVRFDETKGSKRCQVAGIKNYMKVRSLFERGCLSEVNYKWMMNCASGGDPAWLGEPDN